MSRSSYVYVVTWAPSGGLIAAFTVKHELKTWLDKRSAVSRLAITRLRDGSFDTEPVELDRETLEPVRS